MSDLAMAFVGAVIALVGQGVFERWKTVRLGRSLAGALWEELSATEFAEHGGQLTYGGFSTQVFDTLFADISHSLPESLKRAVLRYHWKMKFVQTIGEDGHTSAFFIDRHLGEAFLQWDDLRARLACYEVRPLIALFLRNEELPAVTGNHPLRALAALHRDGAA